MSRSSFYSKGGVAPTNAPLANPVQPNNSEAIQSSLEKASASEAAAKASELAAAQSASAAAASEASTQTASAAAVAAQLGVETNATLAQAAAASAAADAALVAADIADADAARVLAETAASLAQSAAAASETSEDNAALSAAASEASRVASEAARVGAETAETNSAASATASAASASNSAASASDSASSASASANSAAASLASETASAVNAAAANASEVAAATSEANSASSAAASASSAAASAASATAANASEVAAATSEANSASSATASANSAAAASASQVAAATSEANSAASATASANSAAASLASETASASSAAAASASQAAAATSEANSAASATSAANSASAASVSEAATAAIFSAFDDTYLGAKASDPTTDNDGDPLTSGALYFNTTTNYMMVYDGSQWINSYVPATGYLSKVTDDTMTGNLTVTGTITASGGTVWHSGNDGSGSGLDADTLDGVQGSSFLRSDISDTMSGRLSLTGGLTVSGDAGDGPVSQIVISDASPQIKFEDTDSNYDFWLHINSNNFYILNDHDGNDTWDGNYPLQLEADTDTGYMFGGKVWTSSNDGSGSGLAADTLDGYHASTTRNSANTIPIRDGNGYLQLGWINTTSGSTTSTIDRIYASNDTYVRYVTPATFRSQVIAPYYAPKSGSYSNDFYANQLFCDNWVRPTGSSGLYFQSYGGGFHMTDTTWIRAYNNKKFYVSNTNWDAINTAGGVKCATVNNGVPSTSASGTNSVGSYAFLWQNATTARGAGTTLAGSSLRYSGVGANAPNTMAGNVYLTASGTPSGTWRLMGAINGYSSYEHASLWLRIS